MKDYRNKKVFENYPILENTDGPKYKPIPIKYEPSIIPKEYFTGDQDMRETYSK